MPWKDTSPMNERSKFIARNLADQATMTELCAAFGISRKTGYKWLERYEAEGPRGLPDRSLRTYQHSPRNAGIALTTFHASKNDSADSPAFVAIDRKGVGTVGEDERGKARGGIVAGATATKPNADGIGEDSAIQ
jgi:hypothetical protein